MAERNREDAVLALERLHAIDEAAQRLAGGREDADDAAVMHRHDGLHPPGKRRRHDREQLFRAVGDVDMRILLEDHHRIDRRDLLLGEMAMQVEFGADQHLRPDQRAQMREQVALGIGIAVGDHRPVQVDHHGVDRHRFLRSARISSRIAS